MKVNEHPTWRVDRIERLSACDNRPGLKKIYVTILDETGYPLKGIKVGFDTEPSYGMAWDHPDIWGLTDENGYLEWDHFGIPTRYRLWMEDDEIPLIENIRTDLGNEYCRSDVIGGWRPVNRPGIYSYRIHIKRKGEGIPIAPPLIFDVQCAVYADQEPRGYAGVSIVFHTDVEAMVRLYYNLYQMGGVPGGPMEPVCDPFGGWRGIIVSDQPGLVHVVELSRATLWYTEETQKRYCFKIVAWRPEYPHAKGYSEVFSFTLPTHQ